MKLIIDIGNSNTKFGFFENDNPVKFYSIKNSQIFSYRDNMLRMVDSCYVGSVNKRMSSKIFNFIKTQTKIMPIFITNKMFFEKLDVSLINKNQIGLDILALAYFISSNFKNGCGICFGSATFATVVKKNKILGVTICPNFYESTITLSKKIKTLNNFKEEKVESFLGNDTLSALNCGLINCQKSLVGFLSQNTKNKYHINDTIVTGGAIKQITVNKHIRYINNAILLGYELITRIN